MNDAAGAASRISLVPAVAAQIAQDGPSGALARIWLRYLKGLIGEDGIALADVAAPEVRCFDLEISGMTPGFQGFQTFRDGVNAAMPDETIEVREMAVYPDQGVVETLIRCAGTHGTVLMGFAPTGKRVTWDVKTLGRFEGDKLVMRWDRVDMAAFIAQLRDAAE